MAKKRMLWYKIILLISFCFWASHALAVNTLNQGDTLNSNGTLVSNNGLFTLGFNYPESTYLGIWFQNSTKDKPFWLANPDTPVASNPALPQPRPLVVNANNSAQLTLDTTGQLILTDANGNSISLYSGTPATNVAAVLEDSGNFVLQEVTTTGSAGQILWQSFDSPTDSFLPGMKLGVSNKTGKSWSLTSWLADTIPTPGAFTLEWDPSSPELVVKRRGEVFWTSGVLINNQFENIALDAGPLSYNFIVVSNADEDYLMYSVAKNQFTPPDLMNLSLWLLNFDGSIQDQYGTSQYIFPVDECDGSNTDSGCQRWQGPNCRNDGDKFAIISGYFVNTVPTSLNDSSNLTISDCEDLCWKNCSCVGVRIGNTNGTGCAFWYDGPFTRDPSGDAVSYHVIIQDSRPSGKVWIWISIAILIALIMTLLGIFFYLRRRRIKQKERFLQELMTSDRPSDANELENDGNEGHNLNVYSLASIMVATNSFSLNNKLGEGGFGPVYKGKLDGREIAVKRLSRRSGQGLVEFKNELILIAKLQHTNLVRLLGCCIEGEEKMLVYEYMPNKSLDSYIFDESKKGLLDWNKRFSIIEGIAQGLLYLRKYSRLRIIHRDLKVSNILLDEKMNPKISDFGMARIFNTNDLEANTNRVVGTYGYMSPEYAMNGIFSVKSDVFSFGVLILEIVSGKKNHSFFQFDHPINLVGYAWELWKEGAGAAIELLDPTLRDSCSKDRILRCINVGLLCVEDNALDRPTMSDVISMLTSEATQLPTPKQPAFSTARSRLETSLSENKTESCSINGLTLSVMNAR